MIYLSGKIDSGPKILKPLNIFKAWVQTKKLMKRGLVVYTPHLYVFMNIPYEEYMRLNFRAIDKCDEVYFMRNWTESYGARREHEYAKQKGKLITYL